MYIIFGFPSGSDDKDSDCNARDLGPIPGLGRPENNDKGVGIRSTGFFTVELAMSASLRWEIHRAMGGMGGKAVIFTHKRQLWKLRI